MDEDVSVNTRFRVEIDSLGAAYAEDPVGSTIDALEAIVAELRHAGHAPLPMNETGRLWDVNGNRVGSWSLIVEVY